MLYLKMNFFTEAAFKLEDALTTDNNKKERVIKLLMGDEDFLKGLTLDSLAAIINEDAQEVFEEYDTYSIEPKTFWNLAATAYVKRRRIL